MFFVLVDWWKKQRQKRRGGVQHYCKRNRRVSLFGRKEDLSESHHEDDKSKNSGRKRRTWAPTTARIKHHGHSQTPDTAIKDMNAKRSKDHLAVDKADMEEDEEDKDQQCLLFHCIETALASSMVLVDERLVIAENHRPKRWSTGMLQDMRFSDSTPPSAIKRQRRISYRRPPTCGHLLSPIPEVDSQPSSESTVAVS